MNTKHYKLRLLESRWTWVKLESTNITVRVEESKSYPKICGRIHHIKENMLLSIVLVLTHVNNRRSLINLIHKTRDPNNQTVNKPLTKFSHDCNWILSSLSRRIYLIYFDSCQGIPTKLPTYLICFIYLTNYSYFKLN